MGIIDLGKATRIPQPSLPRPVETVSPEASIQTKQITQILTKLKQTVPVEPSEILQAKLLSTNLAWYNKLAQTELTAEDLKRCVQVERVTRAREVIATRMYYIGRMSYPEIAEILSPKNRHSTILVGVKRVLTRVFGSDQLPDQAFIAQTIRSMTDDHWLVLILWRV